MPEAFRDDLVHSHTRVRLALGILGLLLPLILIIGGLFDQLRPEEIIGDDWLATLAGTAAFVVAFFPNGAGGDRASMMQLHFGAAAAETLHYLAAFVFFSSLAGFCLFKFAKTRSTWRRKIYQACGAVIIAMLVLTMIAVYFRKVTDGAAHAIVESNNLIFWFEAIGIWAFALSWLHRHAVCRHIFLYRPPCEPRILAAR